MPIWIRIKEQSRMSEPRKKEGRKKETEADQYSHFLSKQDKGGLKRTIICNHHIFIMTSLLDLVHQNYKYPLRYSKLVTLCKT